MPVDPRLLRSVRFVVAAIVLLGLTVLASYTWNMLIADQILTDRCGFDSLDSDPEPVMTWLGCSE